MVEWHLKSNRKSSGGLRNSVNRATKKLAWKGGKASLPEMAEADERIVLPTRGGNEKTKLREAHFANVLDPKTKKVTQEEIVWIHENDANRLYVRRNIITKGAKIEVKHGAKNMLAQVTNRPGQDGMVNASIVGDVPASREKKEPAKKEKAKETVKA